MKTSFTKFETSEFWTNMKNQNFETKRPKRFKQNLWGVKLKLRFKRSWGPSNSRKAASLKSCESSQSPGTSTKHVDTLTHSWLLLIFKSYANSLKFPKVGQIFVNCVCKTEASPFSMHTKTVGGTASPLTSSGIATLNETLYTLSSQPFWKKQSVYTTNTSLSL